MPLDTLQKQSGLWRHFDKPHFMLAQNYLLSPYDQTKARAFCDAMLGTSHYTKGGFPLHFVFSVSRDHLTDRVIGYLRHVRIASDTMVFPSVSNDIHRNTLRPYLRPTHTLNKLNPFLERFSLDA